MKYAALAAFTLAAATIVAGNSHAAEMTKTDACIKNAVESIAREAFEALSPSIPDYADVSYDIGGNELQSVIADCETRTHNRTTLFDRKNTLTVDRVTLDTVRIRP